MIIFIEIAFLRSNYYRNSAVNIDAKTENYS